MKRYISVLVVAIVLVLSGCSHYKTCPTYTKEKKVQSEEISVSINTPTSENL